MIIREQSITIKHFMLSVISGIVLIISFPNFCFWFLAWLAVLPLLVVVYEIRPKVSFFLGWLAGTVFYLGLLYWLILLYPLIGFLAVLAWIALAVLQGFFIGIFALGASIIRRNYIGWGRLFIIPAWWVSVEYARSTGWLGFPWGVLGYSQQPFGYLTQIVSITGIYGISFIIIMMSVALTELLFSPPEKLRTAFAYLAVAIIILFEVIGQGFISFGNSEQKENKANQGQRDIRVALVQGSIRQEEKWDPLKEDYIKNIYYKLADDVGKLHPYLVILPESSTPSFLLRDTLYLNKLKNLAKRNGYYLLVGSLHLDSKSRQFNSAILISPRGKVVKKYDKLHLVLFGEYIPFKFIGDMFKRFENLAWVGESITPGKDYTVFTTSKGRFSSVICFESADSALCRRMVKRGAQLLVVLTNDAWFGKSAAASQHMQITTFRAIENNVYLVQAANTGISALVNPQGKILKRASLFERDVLDGTVAFRNPKTIYLQWGDIFAYICILLASGCLASAGLKKLTLSRSAK